MTRTKRRSASKSRRPRYSKDKRSKRTSRSKQYLKKKDRRSKTKRTRSQLPYVMKDYHPISRHQPYSVAY